MKPSAVPTPASCAGPTNPVVQTWAAMPVENSDGTRKRARQCFVLSNDPLHASAAMPIVGTPDSWDRRHRLPVFNTPPGQFSPQCSPLQDDVLGSSHVSCTGTGSASPSRGAVSPLVSRLRDGCTFISSIPPNNALDARGSSPMSTRAQSIPPRGIRSLPCTTNATVF